MTYLPNIPIADDSPKNQAPLIQVDFAQFASVFSTTLGGNKFNHSPIGTSLVNSPNQGDHETILFQNQAADPIIKDTFDCLYARNATSALGTQPQLFLRLPIYLPNKFVGKGPGNPPMQMTYNQVNNSGPIYQSFLPGGYLLFWGAVNLTTNSRQITLPLTTTKILIAIAYPNTQQNLVRGNARKVSTTIDTSTKFTINTTSLTGTQPFNFMVIAIA